MGCDIHTMAEVKKDVYDYVGEGKERRLEVVGTKWKAIKRDLFPNPYFYENAVVGDYNYPYTNAPYVGRNYELFSVLADVRNERQSSNIFDPTMRYEMRDAIEPIALPRGVPDDASKGWRKYVKSWGSDLHSTSFFALDELLAAIEGGAFEQKYTNRGYIGIDAYRELKANGTEPQMWAGWSSNGIAEAAYLAMTPEQQASYKGMVAAEWPSSITEGMTEFLKSVEQLKRLAPFIGKHPGHDAITANGGVDPRERDYTAVRLVFGFDN